MEHRGDEQGGQAVSRTRGLSRLRLQWSDSRRNAVLPYIYRHGLGKRFTEYQTMGELFSDMEDDLMALTLWKRVLACIERILRVLGETLGVTPQHLMTTIYGNDKEMSKILVMAEALEKWDEVYGQTT